MIAENMLENDQWSPECLMTSEPVRDPYSTDEELDRGKKLRKTAEKTSYKDINVKYYSDISLKAVNNGSNFKGEQSYFYQSVHFQKINKEVILEDKSVLECLVYLFKFSSSKFFDEHNCTWNGEQITELLSREMKMLDFKWFVENDNIDWKSASPEKRSEIRKLHELLITGQNQNINLYGPRQTQAVLNVARKTQVLYDELCSQNVKSISNEERRCIVRTCIESIASFVSPCHYQRNGNCYEEFEFYVPVNLVSDKSPLTPEGRAIVIKNKPDGVFTFPYTITTPNGTKDTELWLIPIEVYCPDSEKEIQCHRCSPPYTAPANKVGSPIFKPQVLYQQDNNVYERSCAEDQRTNKTVESPKLTSSSQIRDTLPPKVSQDNLLNSTFIEDTQKYILESLPKQCRSSHFCDKIAGKHVQQLLAAASQITTLQSSFMEDGILEILGLFVDNEYVYFSRLDIEKLAMYFFSGIPYKKKMSADIGMDWCNPHIKVFHDRVLKMPCAFFSNFRLDLTIATHRLALMIFIANYIQTFVNAKL